MAEEIKSLDDLQGAVDGAEGVVAEEAIKREPQRDELGRSYATGKRKDAVARVWVRPGSGKVTVNGKDLAKYFARPVLQMSSASPSRSPASTGSSTSSPRSRAAVCPVRPAR